MPKAKKTTEPIRSKDVPVTQAMLYLVRDELKSHIISHESRFDSIDKRFEAIDKRFEAIDKRFESMDKRFDSIDQRFDSLESKLESMFSKIDAKLDKMQAEIHCVKLLAEEQNARNIYVMDQYHLLDHRCEKNEKRIDEVEKDFRQLLLARDNEPKP